VATNPPLARVADEESGFTALHWCACEGRDRCAAVLLEAGADTGAQDCAGMTPLAWAAAKGREDLTRVLLEAGGGANTRDEEGRTP